MEIGRERLCPPFMIVEAQWRSPSDAWERSLVERDDRTARAGAFADAASILGEYLKDARSSTAETAALLNWFHDRAGPFFIDDAAANDGSYIENLRPLCSPIPLPWRFETRGDETFLGLKTDSSVSTSYPRRRSDAKMRCPHAAQLRSRSGFRSIYAVGRVTPESL